jgi:hypothetical protein
MKVISHRGYWTIDEEKNSELAFRRSFSNDYGTETDVRDARGDLVISHGMPLGGEMTLEDFFKLPGATYLPLALNIKSDGIARFVLESVIRNKIENWFVFDMSVPDMKSYLELGCPVYCRMSEVEKIPAWFDRCTGIWLDSFGQEWYDARLITELLSTGKELCVVSSELHNRDNIDLWEMLLPFTSKSRITLCTDQPELATDYFNS